MTLALAGPDESVWVVVGSTLHRLSARDGSKLWSLPYRPPPDVALSSDLPRPDQLFPRPDGSVWWAANVFDTRAGDSSGWTWDVALVGADGTVSWRQWNRTHDAPVAFPDGTLLRLLEYGGFDVYEPVPSHVGEADPPLHHQMEAAAGSPCGSNE
jgi:hypothetical protein